jgi:hypothetical protein
MKKTMKLNSAVEIASAASARVAPNFQSLSESSE